MDDDVQKAVEAHTKPERATEGGLSEAEEANRYNTLGITQATQNMLPQAIVTFSKAIEIDPKDPRVYANRAFAYEGKGQYARAIADFTKALEMNPKDADTYNNRALSYYYNKQYDKALDDVGKAQSLGYRVDPAFVEALRAASGNK